MLTTRTFNKEKYYSLDFVRGIAALIVAISHFSYGTIQMSHIAAGVSVGFFFILSGFVLSHAYKTQIEKGNFTFNKFVVTRIARLYPLHILTFSFVVLYWAFIEFMPRSHFPTTMDWQFWPAFEGITLTHLLFQGSVAFNSPAWSISVEFWGSLYLFFLCAPFKKFYKFIAIAVVTILFSIVEMHGGFLNATDHWVLGFIEKNYITGLACFTFGWAIYNIKISVPPALAWGFTGLLFALMLWPPVDLKAHTILELAYFGAFGIAIVMLASAQPKNSIIIKGMETSGNMSYGIYLWHVPVMLIVTALEREASIHLGWHFRNEPIINWFYLGTLLPVAWLSYKFYEMPAQKWIRHKFSKTKPE